MDKQALKIISDRVEGVQLIKSNRNDSFFCTSDSTIELLKGFRIAESRFSATISLWISPIAHFPAFGLNIFDSYELQKSNGEVGEINLPRENIKEHIDDLIINAEQNTCTLKRIQDSKTLVEWLLENKENWLISPFSKAQLSLVLSDLGQYERATGNLAESLPRMNPRNPITKEALTLYELLLDENFNKIKDLIEQIKAVNRQERLDLWD